MKCKDLRKHVRYGYRQDTLNQVEAAAHAKQCRECRDLLAIESLTSALFKAHSESTAAEPADHPYLMSRIRGRIRELSEHGVGSWESAILTMRPWLLAFGAAAVILLAISVQWQLSNSVSPSDLDNEVTVLSNLNEDYIGGNIPAAAKAPDAFAFTLEAINNAHK